MQSAKEALVEREKQRHASLLWLLLLLFVCPRTSQKYGATVGRGGGLNKANGGKGGFHNVRVRYLVAGATDNRLYKSNAFNRGGGQQPMMLMLFRAFFSQRGLYFHPAKNHPPLRPRSTFSEHDFGHIGFLKKVCNFVGTNSGSYSGQKFICFC